MMSNKLKANFLKFIHIFSLLFLVIFYQNCTQNQDVNLSTRKSENIKFQDGQAFDGKLRVLHHYVHGFRCEGALAPESILTRVNDSDWFLTRNTPEKCGALIKEFVTNVVFDEVKRIAVFEGTEYVPPRPYDVDFAANPNLSDLDLLDGICSNINNQCSLRAAFEQSSATALTTEVVINIPEGVYKLNQPLLFNVNYNESKKIRIHGVDPSKTIIDGGQITSHFIISSLSKSEIYIDNLTFQNGSDPNSNLKSASILIDPVGSSLHNLTDVEKKWAQSSSVIFDNCIFKNNPGNSNSIIHSLSGSGKLSVLNTQFVNNGYHGIHIENSNSLHVENGLFIGNNRGIVVENNVSSVTIKNSIFSQNYQGILLDGCKNCLIDNISTDNNSSYGMYINILGETESDNVIVSKSTLSNNNGNIFLYSMNSKAAVKLINSKISIPNSTNNSNCSWIPEPVFSYHRIISVNSIFSDSSCQEELQTF